MNDTTKATKYFYFTIGPVQDFVAQARRTRDFWAGSFILSWLAGVAIQSVREQGGRIDFPKLDENFMSFLIVEQDEDSKKREREGEYKDKLPKQGSIPNRFKASVPSTFNSEQAKNVAKDVKAAWIALAEQVWKKDLESFCNENYAHIKKTIWDEQINKFWEISWVLTEDKDASDLLDRRKNLRTHQPPPQKGVKCMVMDGWQELSGGESSVNEKFWKDISSRLGSMELREDEHLCAIAFVKRRFHDVFENFAFPKEKPHLTGWKVHSSVPSSYYIAAVHWLEKALPNVELKANFNELTKTAEKLGFGRSEKQTDIYCLRDFSNELTHYDGNIFFEHDLLVNFSTEQRKEKQSEYNAHLDNLKEIYKIAETRPSPFYAVLIMDGDSLGEKMGKKENPPEISDALDKFTKTVPCIVGKNNGFLIYSGGDDVLAILPLEDALKCAAQVHKYYKDCFKDKNDDLKDSTISAAIEFVHVKTPLRIVLKDAHSLLDKIAKEKTGRDAIAVRVWKGSGCALEWAMPFQYALDDKGQFKIEKLANDFRDKKTSKEAEFSSKFFYKIRERFELLNPEQDEEQQGDDMKNPENPEDAETKQKEILNKDMAISLLTADYLNSRVNREKPENQKLSFEEAKVRVGKLLEQCRPVKRKLIKNQEENSKVIFCISKKLQADGALLIRFLAQYWQIPIKENKGDSQ